MGNIKKAIKKDPLSQLFGCQAIYNPSSQTGMILIIHYNPISCIKIDGWLACIPGQPKMHFRQIENLGRRYSQADIHRVTERMGLFRRYPHHGEFPDLLFHREIKTVRKIPEVLLRINIHDQHLWVSDPFDRSQELKDTKPFIVEEQPDDLLPVRAQPSAEQIIDIQRVEIKRIRIEGIDIEGVGKYEGIGYENGVRTILRNFLYIERLRAIQRKQ
jgi:hypothetical protein